MSIRWVIALPLTVRGLLVKASAGEANEPPYFLSDLSIGGINGWVKTCKNLQFVMITWYIERGVKEINHFALASREE